MKRNGRVMLAAVIDGDLVAASTEGLLVYSLDDAFAFDPYDLSIEVTPEATRTALQRGEYARALSMAFRLGEEDLAREACEAVPPGDLELVVPQVARVHLPRLMTLLGSGLESSRRLEFHLLWLTHIFRAHGRYIRDNPDRFGTALRSVLKGTTRQKSAIGRLCDENRYSIVFLQKMAKVADAGVLGGIEGSAAE